MMYVAINKLTDENILRATLEKARETVQEWAKAKFADIGVTESDNVDCMVEHEVEVAEKAPNLSWFEIHEVIIV